MINFFKNLFKKEENKGNNNKEKINIKNLDLKGLEKTYYENQTLENIEIPNPQDRSSVKIHTTQKGNIKKLEIDATAIKHVVNEARLAKETDEEYLKRQRLEKLQKTMDDYANIIASRVLERARPKIQEAAEKLINEIEKRNKASIKEEMEPIKNEITEIKTNIKEIKDAITGNLSENKNLNEFNDNIENLTETESIQNPTIKEKEEVEPIETKEIDNKDILPNNLKEEKTEIKEKTENNQEQEDPEDQIKAILQKAKEKKQQQNSNKKEDSKKQNTEQDKENKQEEKTVKPNAQKSTKTNNAQDNKNNNSQDEKEEKRKKKIEKIIKDIKANIKLIENMKKIEEKEKELKIVKQLINNEFKNDKEAIEIVLKETNLEEIESKLKSIKEETPAKEELDKKNNNKIIDNQENKSIEKDIDIKEQKISYYLEEISKIKEHIESNLDSLKSQYIYMIVGKFKEKIEKEPNKNEILNAIDLELNKIIEVAKKKENNENEETQNKSKKADIFNSTPEKNTKKEIKIIYNLLEKTKEIKNIDQELIKLQETEMEKEENDAIFK